MFGLTFDLANFFNTLIGSVIGGIISVVISYFFFLKGKGVETLSNWISHNLGEIFVRQARPQFFGTAATRVTPTETVPVDSDVPRLTAVIVTPAIPSVGSDLEILCRVSDEGWNFPMASGLVIEDPLGRKHPVQNAEFGYMYSKIHVPSTHTDSNFTLTFCMHDLQQDGSQKSCVQTIRLKLQRN